jgi:hypothetical protein
LIATVGNTIFFSLGGNLLKRHTFIACFACVLGLTTWSHAQAVPTASRAGTIQIGLGGTFVSPDYGSKYAKGLSIYGDFDFTHHLGVEGDIHFASLITPTDIGENSYLIGPRYRYSRNRFTAYGKALFGIGQFQFQQGTYGSGSSATYGVYAFGGGLDVRATHHINVRAIDFEYQKWPGFAPNGLTPYATTIGVAYAFR